MSVARIHPSRRRRRLSALALALCCSLALASSAQATSTLKVCASGCPYTSIAGAVAAATPGRTIEIRSPQVVTSTVTIDKHLKIKARSGATISTSGTLPVLRITAGGSRTELDRLSFIKTDKAGEQRVVEILGTTGVRVRRVSFDGNWTYNEGHVVRGLWIENSTGFQIRDSTFRSIRQPAFFMNSAGLVRKNYADDTRGWVVDSTTGWAGLRFSSNRWGTNAVDIAYIRQPLQTCAVTDAQIVKTSKDNRRAVVENQCHTLPPNGYSATESTLSRVLVRAGVVTGADEPGGPRNPFGSIQAALNRVAEGGTVYVENGVYSESFDIVKHGTRLAGQSRAGVQVSANGASPTGYGIALTGRNGVSIRTMTLIMPAGPGRPPYHLKAYQGSALTLEDLTFQGPGRTEVGPRTGGVDVNSVDGVVIEDVVSRDYSRNGFAFTAQFAAGDPVTRNVRLEDIDAIGNAWAGVALYAYNSSGTIGHTITGVKFSGHNTITGNDKGIEIVGATDPQVSLGTAPAYAITSKGGNRVDVGRTAFAGNLLFDVVNYQTMGLKAKSATFSGKRGRSMNSAERAAQNAKIVDRLDHAGLGLVSYR